MASLGAGKGARVLQLDEVRKTYHTGTFTQAALDGVTITFRDNEFVAVLGPSGSGKTTLLNIVGGLDHADSGDLLIDQVSTSEYTDRDWDTYRNNRIGFVFQSYNLIPHQSVLSNVELALTLSGVGAAERKQRAIEALKQVDLEEHMNKLPNQLSGGQMQRVAIARALINDPEILLADEPTGALDSKTGVQVMNLLEGIAKDRLVVMVTHNPDLAQTYANRIVSLKDGQVVGDTRPYTPDIDLREAKPARRASMSFLTAIALSFTNLMTKKGRTLMTSFAGSIGIVGIAAILAVANGVNAYIRDVEEGTLSLYPLTIQTQGIDLTAMLAASSGTGLDDGTDPSSADAHEMKAVSRMFSRIGTNDLASLKTFLDSSDSGIQSHVNAIQYNYSVTPQIFASDTTDGVRQVNPNNAFSSLGFSSSSTSSLMSMSMNMNTFSSLPDDMGLLDGQYDLVAGHWPQNYNECVLVLTESGGIADMTLYTMGLRDPAELQTMVSQLAANQPITVPSDIKTFTYDQLMAVSFTVVNAVDFYGYDPTYKVWTDHSSDTAWMKKAVAGGEPLKVSGVVRPNPSATATMLNPGLFYPSSLVHHLIDEAADSPIVKEQLASPTVNVFSGETFTEEAKRPSLSDFDFASMISIDQDAMSQLFSFDLSGFSPSLPDMDFSSLAGSMPAVPPPDLTSMMSGLTLQISPEAMQSLLSQTLADYLRDVYGISGESPGGTPTGLPSVLPTWLPTSLPSGLPTGSQTGQPTPAETPTGTATPTPTPTSQAPTSSAPTTSGPSAPSPSTTPSVPGGLPTEIPGLPDLNGIIDSFSAWFAQPAVQAQFGARLAQSLDTDQMEQQMAAGMTGYMQQIMQTMLTSMMGSLQTQLTVAMEATMAQLSTQMSSAMDVSPEDFAKIFTFNMDTDQLTSFLMSVMNNQTNSLDSNLGKLGYADLGTPNSISIYPKDFAAKQQVIDILDSYNNRMTTTGQDDKVITYTDIVGTLMSSVTDIVNKISAVLVAFVSISLVVSSIMIGVITYISVLERRKEIGILRAMGASKRDIGNVFNAETLIVGFVAGLMGVLITVLLTVIANPIVYHLTDVKNIAQLPLWAGIALIAVSMFLTFLAGLIPSSAASRADPVEALRSE